MGRGLQSQAHVDSNSSLILRPLTKEAHGRWECTASNAVAQVATSTNVYVLGLWLQSWGLQETVGQEMGNHFWRPRWGWWLGDPWAPLSSLPSLRALTIVLHSSYLGTSPHVVTNVSVVPLPKSANVSWEPGFDGGYLQRFSIWYTPL